MRDGSLAALSLLVIAMLTALMLKLAGRNPGIIGPEIDSPFFEANVDSIQGE